MIVDPLHKTMPFITKYEKARVLGERAKQLNMGAKPLVEIGPEVIDGYLIALKEMEEKKIPFIIKRPLPSGGCEYWKCKDLEVLGFVLRKTSMYIFFPYLPFFFIYDMMFHIIILRGYLVMHRLVVVMVKTYSISRSP